MINQINKDIYNDHINANINRYEKTLAYKSGDALLKEYNYYLKILEFYSTPEKAGEGTVLSSTVRKASRDNCIIILEMILKELEKIMWLYLNKI